MYKYEADLSTYLQTPNWGKKNSQMKPLVYIMAKIDSIVRITNHYSIIWGLNKLPLLTNYFVVIFCLTYTWKKKLENLDISN